jgi:cleavage and polyadenylation specificity factor subunit 1
MFQLHYGSKCSSPSTICSIQAQKQQRSKVFCHTITPLGDFTPPAVHFLHIHIDLVGPLPTSVGYMYCLTAVDRFTRWPEVVPIPDITADTVACALLTGWISHFGCPKTITIDQGHQFESQIFQSLARLCGIQLSRTTAHHPAVNGLIELIYRTLKAAIMCHADQQWTQALPLVLADPVDPAHLITKFRQYMARLRPVPAERHASPATFVHSNLEKCTQVFLCQDTTRRALEPPLQRPLPGPVTQREDIATCRAREARQCVSRQGQAGLHPQWY